MNPSWVTHDLLLIVDLVLTLARVNWWGHSF